MSGNGRAVVAGETDPVSAPLPAGVSHLLIADDALIPGRWGAHVTLCGEQVRRPNAGHDDPWECPGYRCCPECVGEAARWSARAGQTAGGVR